jgi:hypothetical protein
MAQQYEVARGGNVEHLIQEVNQFIALGYRPHGSMVVHRSGGYYLQPMLKDAARRIENKGPG